jgi:hypothetical protein
MHLQQRHRIDTDWLGDGRDPGRLHATLRTSLNLAWDRCYDFFNIFAEKFSKKIGVFDSKKLNYAKF